MKFGSLVMLLSLLTPCEYKLPFSCFRDAYIVSLGDAITSVFAGLVIFAILGFMANELSTTVDKVADEGSDSYVSCFGDCVAQCRSSPELV